MKKKIRLASLAAAAVCCFGMALSAGAAESEAVTEAATEAAAAEIPVTNQRRLIVGQLNTWKPADGSGRYCVTDLDQNGRYEIISAKVSDGTTAQAGIWEVSEDGKKLNEITVPWEDGSCPNLVVEEADVYYDSDSDTYYFAFTAADGTSTDLISLKDGALSMDEISSVDGTDYADLEKKTGELHWISTQEHALASAPMEQVLELVEETSTNFDIE